MSWKSESWVQRVASNAVAVVNITLSANGNLNSTPTRAASRAKTESNVATLQPVVFPFDGGIDPLDEASQINRVDNWKKLDATVVADDLKPLPRRYPELFSNVLGNDDLELRRYRHCFDHP